MKTDEIVEVHTRLMLNFGDIGSSFMTHGVPELILALGGLLVIGMVYLYIKDKEGKYYKSLVALGIIFGLVMIITAYFSYTSLRMSTVTLIVVVGFAMILRPFKEIKFAIIFAIMVMVLAYMYLGALSGGTLDVLSAGWPRIIIMLIAGAFTYMVLHFIEAIIQFFGKLVNAWPVLIVIGVLCIAEAICVFLYQKSIFDFIRHVFGMVIPVCL